MKTIAHADTQTDRVKTGNPATFLAALNSGSNDFRYEVLAALLADEIKGFQLQHFRAHPLF